MVKAMLFNEDSSYRKKQQTCIHMFFETDNLVMGYEQAAPCRMYTSQRAVTCT